MTPQLSFRVSSRAVSVCRSHAVTLPSASEHQLACRQPSNEQFASHSTTCHGTSLTSAGLGRSKAQPPFRCRFHC